MKLRTAFLVFVAIILFSGIMTAQMNTQEANQSNTSGKIPLGFGATFIDGETYYLINFAPEVAFGKLGFGLDLNLRYSTSGKLKSEYNKFEDYLRIIRYVRWAQKGDPFYVRVGQLDYSLLGHGFILYNYRNTASYDLRKTGMELDLNFDKFGFESVVSDFAHAGIFGARGYVKPLKFTSLSKVPVIKNFEVGATFVSDLNDNANKTQIDSNNTGSFSVVGFDLGLPLLSYRVIKSTLYFDYAKIIHYGSGSAVGIDFRFAGLGLLTLSAKYERRFNGDQFVPSYFNALYERDRYELIPSGGFKSKADSLRNVKSNQGNYGELMISVLNTLNIIGAYQAPVGVKNAGMFHAELNTGNALPSIVLEAGFDKRNIGRVFKLDDNSILYAEVGYKPVSFMVVSALYQWTWTKDDNGAYKTQKRIEPKLSFVFNF
ncbi:MAG: hypothetical protein KBG83_02770 [Bacteroidetes bacterium]|nr:hypothetical protein [Bacteroidota bacterium]